MKETITRYRYTYTDPDGHGHIKDIYAENAYLANEYFWSDKRENYSINLVQCLGTYEKTNDDTSDCSDNYPEGTAYCSDNGLHDDVMPPGHDNEFWSKRYVFYPSWVTMGTGYKPDGGISNGIRKFFHRLFRKGGQT